MTVSRENLEAHLDRVRAAVRDPREGLYGTSSMVWRLNREQLLFIAGARAALLQEAHPFVAHGVDQHSLSKTLDDRSKPAIGDRIKTGQR